MVTGGGKAEKRLRERTKPSPTQANIPSRNPELKGLRLHPSNFHSRRCKSTDVYSSGKVQPTLTADVGETEKPI